MRSKRKNTESKEVVVLGFIMSRIPLMSPTSLTHFNNHLWYLVFHLFNHIKSLCFNTGCLYFALKFSIFFYTRLNYSSASGDTSNLELGNSSPFFSSSSSSVNPEHTTSTISLISSQRVFLFVSTNLCFSDLVLPFIMFVLLNRPYELKMFR